MAKLAKLWCTGFGLGHLPGRGTLASIIIFALGYWLLAFNSIIGQIALVLIILLSLILTYPAAKLYTQKDPLEIISDEVAASAVLALIIPWSWYWFLIAFIIFRFFDISKALGVKKLEELAGATGILADDLGAAVYAYVIILIIHVWL